MTSDVREGMADDLEKLGLYLTSNLVRKGNISLSHGIEHVRHYCLPEMVRAVRSREEYDAEYPPTPGTWGAVALANIRTRRDELQQFLDTYAALTQQQSGHVCDPEWPCEPNDHICKNYEQQSTSVQEGK